MIKNMAIENMMANNRASETLEDSRNRRSRQLSKGENIMYVIRGGCLYNEGKPVMSIRTTLGSQEMEIIDSAQKPIFKTSVVDADEVSPVKSGDVRNKRYVIRDMEGHTYASGRPEYANSEAPEKKGWPVNRLPMADDVDMYMEDRHFHIHMNNSRNYDISDGKGAHSMNIRHKGLKGGWDIETEGRLKPEDICGIFVFCRYLERENEFDIV